MADLLDSIAGRATATGRVASPIVQDLGLGDELKKQTADEIAARKKQPLDANLGQTAFSPAVQSIYGSGGSYHV